MQMVFAQKVEENTISFQATMVKTVFTLHIFPLYLNSPKDFPIFFNIVYAVSLLIALEVKSLHLTSHRKGRKHLFIES